MRRKKALHSHWLQTMAAKSKQTHKTIAVSSMPGALCERGCLGESESSINTQQHNHNHKKYKQHSMLSVQGRTTEGGVERWELNGNKLHGTAEIIICAKHFFTLLPPLALIYPTRPRPCFERGWGGETVTDNGRQITCRPKKMLKLV